MFRLFIAFLLLEYSLGYKVHCGSKKVPIPHVFIDQLVRDLAVEMVNAADDIWEVKKNEGWVQKEAVLRIMNIAGSMHLSWNDRISSVAFLFSEMKKQEMNGVILWMAEYECIRVEKWAKTLILLGVRDVTGLLETIISYPWDHNVEWGKKSAEMKGRTVAWTLKKEVCF